MQAIVRRFPSIHANFDNLGEIQRREVHAVSEAIRLTESMEDGDERLKLVKALYWTRHRKTMAGIAMELYISRATACRWNSDFILTVAECFGLYIRK